MTPFSLRHSGRFEVEPGDVFDLTSEEYARKYNAVKEVARRACAALLGLSKIVDIFGVGTYHAGSPTI